MNTEELLKHESTARDFLETLLSDADNPDNEEHSFHELTIYNFTPEFIKAVIGFCDAATAHLESEHETQVALDNCERSLGGNLYFSLSGAGVGFFDESKADGDALQKALEDFAGAHRFEELANMLDREGEDGPITLSYKEKFLPVGLMIYFEIGKRWFALSEGEIVDAKTPYTMHNEHPGGPWVRANNETEARAKFEALKN